LLCFLYFCFLCVSVPKGGNFLCCEAARKWTLSLWWIFALKILAIETSTEHCSVALWQDGALSGRSELVGQRHSEVLMDMLDSVLREADMKLAQLDGIAFGAGPGSFTGVRIACGVAQGLALGANLPVAGICTLQALAQASGHTRVIAALDARMGEIYHAAYEAHGATWVTVHEPSLCTAQQAPEVMGEDWFGVGSAFALHGEVFAARYAGRLLGSDVQAVPQAAAVAQLAARVFAAGRGMDAALAAPLYLRDKVALKTSER
jgi:tRNA threonylcarbamoyladenosine biosynthesis protein TsaB